jgi:putative sterol carrier protein
MKSDVLDGVMSGRTNAFTAAMSGKIQITGDLMKAATLQKALKDMVRIYTQAKSEVEK